jgi:tetratricopeptide (TPR) repeat protein
LRLHCARTPADGWRIGWEERSRGSRLLAALVSAAYVAVSLPVFFVSTRAHPLALDACLLMAAFLLCLVFSETPAWRWFYLFAFVYGLGCVDFATFLLLAPLAAFAWLLLLWRARMLSWVRIAAAAPVFLLGYSLFFLACWQYYRGPVAEWREFKDFAMVLRYFLLEQYHALLYTVPRYGWLLILLLMVVPGAIVLSGRLEDARDPFTKLGVNLFRVILLLLAVIPLFDLPGTPWRMTGVAHLIITPYLITGLWVGYLVGSWHSALGQTEVYDTPFNILMASVSRPALIVAVTAVLAAGGVRHAIEAGVHHARPIVQFADRVLDSLEGRTWLLSDGTLDTLLQLRARERGQDLRLLDRVQARTKPYLRFVSGYFDSPDLRSLARVGLQPLLDVWLDKDKDITKKLAVLDYPNLWGSRGFRSLPQGPVFVGQGLDEPVDADRVFASTFAGLQGFTNHFAGTPRRRLVLAPYYARIHRHLGMAANNLGVMMDEMSRTNEAWSAYQLARAFDGSNLSALFNALQLAERGGRPEAAELRSRLQSATRKTKSLPPLWKLSMEFGYVRDPAVYAREGVAWTLAGRSSAGLEKMEQAIDLAPEASDLRLAMARLCLAEQMPDEGADAYGAVLEKDPANVEALRALARIDIMRGRPDAAQGYLDKLDTAKVPLEETAFERGLLAMVRGRRDEARDIFRDLAKQDDDFMPAWLALGLLARDQGDAALLGKAVDRLGRADRYAEGFVFLGDLALERRDVQAAREHIERAARLQPLNRTVMEKRLNIALVERRLSDARELAADLLNFDAGNAVANYVMGMLHYQDGQRDMAEAMFRRSIESRPTGPALNDLAWLLSETDRNKEAVELARRATEIMPDQPLFWGTRAVILNRLKRGAESADAFDRGLYYGLRHPEALLIAARVFMEQGMPEKVRPLLEYLDTQNVSWDAAQQADLDLMRRHVRPQSAATSPPVAGPTK